MGNCCSCKITPDEQSPPLPPQTPDSCPSVEFHEDCSQTDYDQEHPCHCDHNSNSEMVTTTMKAITSNSDASQFCFTLVTPEGLHPSKLTN